MNREQPIRHLPGGAPLDDPRSPIIPPDAAAARLFAGHAGIDRESGGIDLLCRIVAGFAAVPYENLTKIIAKYASVSPAGRFRDPERLVRGFVEEATGGTCFSLTWCLGAILASFGFRCYPVMADMKRENVHCALVAAAADRRWLVDPGYLIGEPVELSGRPVRLAAPFGTVELRPRGSHRYDLYTIAGDEVKWRYRVKTQPVSMERFLRFWRDSFDLPMMHSLQLTRLTDGGHLYVRDHHLRLLAGSRKINENIREGLESRIEAEFGIPGRITAEARELIERMKSTWRPRERGDRPPSRP
ncbi:MAG: arylamine N-acetyltransferase [Candidatus Krumholzibacteriota bacterium]|nr:arylamine N-acetyltransferase [Candidatus Krumholzibacteriota bacterium]